MGEKRLGEEKTPKKKKRNRGRARMTIASLCLAGAVAAGVVVNAAYTTCYTVEYQGSPVAYVDNKAAIQRAVLQAESLTSDLLQTDYSFGQDLQVRAAIVPRNSVSPTAEAADSLMEQIPELTRLYTLTVDGTYIGAAERADTITRALERVKDQYRTADTISVSIESELDLEYAFVAVGTETMDEDQFTEALLRPVTRTFPYTTQEGDTMENVAQRFSMDARRLERLNSQTDLEIEATDTDIASLDEILGDTKLDAVVPEEAEDQSQEPPLRETRAEAATDDIQAEDMADVDPETLAAEAVRDAYAAVDAVNGLTENEDELILTAAPLRPGQKLTVEQTCSLLVVATVEEQVAEREVLPEKLTLLDSSIPVGTQEVLVEGTPGTDTVMTRVTKRCGVPVSSADLSRVSLQRADPLLVAVGYGSHPELHDFFGVEGLLFQWPVQGHISSDYGYRHIFGGLNFHRGVDIPAPKGTAVHAAADGTVIFAGVKGSYGNLVIIDHGNGFQTLYGHNSGFLVKAGDTVVRGQTIAAVGSTGRSTGPHCHFEVHLNGELVDPLMYLPGDNNAPVRMQVPLSELNRQMEEAEAQTSASVPQKPAETAPPAEQKPTPEPVQSPEEETPAPAEPSGEENPAPETPADAGEPGEKEPQGTAVTDPFAVQTPVGAAPAQALTGKN